LEDFLSHYKQYFAFKGSESEWLGQLPFHWGVSRIKSLISSSQNGFWGDEPMGDENDVLCARVADFNRVNLTVGDHLTTIRNVPSFQRESRAVQCGDLLFEKSGGGEQTLVGAIVQYTGVKTVICSNFVAVVKCKPGVNPRWLCYANFHLYSIGVNIRSIKQATGIQNIDAEDYFNERIAVPTKNEQIAIAEHLDSECVRIDALTRKKEHFIELLVEKRQAMITKAVTKGLDSSVSMKNSGVEWLGEVPEHWSVTPLKYLAKFQSGGTPSKENKKFWDGEFPWASAKDMKTEQLSDTVDHISELAFVSGGATLVPSGRVLVVVRGMILARIFPVVETLVPMAINQDLKALTAGRMLENQFLAYLLRGLASESLRRLEEAGHGTKALRMESWTSMRLTVPPIIEQREIVEFIVSANSRIEKLIVATQNSIKLLNERRNALITAAVTGQIDLREAA
jgi:type I restriction enzyme S subunit